MPRFLAALLAGSALLAVPLVQAETLDSQAGKIARKDVVVRLLVDHAPRCCHPLDRREVQHVWPV